jgi:hypothetical protein
VETNLVTLPIAQHVLWHFGDTNLGLQPGTFVERLLLAMSAADAENLAKLAQAFPGYVAAFWAVGHESWGLDWLRTMAKRGLVPDDALQFAAPVQS